MTYVATFFAHIGAIRFHKLCQADGLCAELRPVPRTLSSSCGTCVFFEAAEGSSAETAGDSSRFQADTAGFPIPVPKGVDWEEVEQIALSEEDHFEVIYESC